MVIAVSACLLGKNCKYNGCNNRCEAVLNYVAGHTVIAVCPEQLGGLTTPREPCEIRNGTVVTKSGVSCDSAFRRGAALALETVKRCRADAVILQPRSPSCGVRQIYDGNFSGRLIEGAGVFAQMLKDAGYTVLEPADIQ